VHDPFVVPTEHLTDGDAEHLTDAEYLTDGDAEYDADADADAEHLSSASGRSDAEPVTECASAGHDRNGSAASR
jgi:hypothetical protein